MQGVLAVRFTFLPMPAGCGLRTRGLPCLVCSFVLGGLFFPDVDMISVRDVLVSLSPVLERGRDVRPPGPLPRCELARVAAARGRALYPLCHGENNDIFQHCQHCGRDHDMPTVRHARAVTPRRRQLKSALAAKA